MVLDVSWDSVKSNAKVIVWPKKDTDNDNQLWTYDNGYIINKNSGLGKVMLLGLWKYVLLTYCFRALLLSSVGYTGGDKQVIQYKRKMIEDAQNQRWYYREDGFIYPQVDPNLVLDIRGNWTKPGTVVLLYERKYQDNENQLWDLIPEVTEETGSLHSSIDPDEYSFSTASYAL
ncbi:ricin B lectin domain-containing protein [Radiomyces spectabilis]|uniref:ricin B lectin domain-containing protein n=1 Tax=Radiomyces spectabilis TaxID=64574 RepID=UPI00222004F9|nr:ricin B lectin domain-containing protein [Radiomyces spectabilis]KAI8374464.1 ricin B lectin domain-containing protein [Radiomyces spectabilis]